MNRKKSKFWEHFYVADQYIFSRYWQTEKNGKVCWTQQASRKIFAKEDGPAACYFANGKVKNTTFFRKGRVVGPCKVYYPSGPLYEVCEGHVNGRLYGIVTTFHENGQIMAKARWENDRLVEILLYKDEQGNDLPIGTFIDGNGTWNWMEKGKQTLVYTYKNGKLIRQKTLKG